MLATVACQPSSVSYRMTSSITRRALVLMPLALLSGCNMVVMNASGDIARQQGQLVVVSTLLMLLPPLGQSSWERSRTNLIKYHPTGTDL